MWNDGEYLSSAKYYPNGERDERFIGDMAGGFFAHGLIGFIALVLVGGLLDVLGRARNAYPNDAQTKSEMKKKRNPSRKMTIRAVEKRVFNLEHRERELYEAYDRLLNGMVTLQVMIESLQPKPARGKRGR